VIAGMQQVVGSNGGQVHRKLGSVGIVDGVQHHVDLFQQLAAAGIGYELLGQLIDMAGAGDFIGVLAPGVHNRSFEGGFLGPGPQQGRGGQGDVRGPNVAAQIAAAHRVHVDAGIPGEAGEDGGILAG
jgi:hypothetical protein